MKTKHIIDMDAPPVLPEWATLVEHQKAGQFEWDASKLNLHLVDEQKNGHTINGNSLRERLKNEPVVNVNLANFLVKNPSLFPEEWKGKGIYFWGTIVLLRYDDLRVPCLLEGGGKVVLRWNWLDDDWSAFDPALRFASPLKLDPSESTLSLESLAARLEKLEAWKNQSL